MRPCIACRETNEVIIESKVSLPRIDTYFDQFMEVGNFWKIEL